jgi:GAF domain-containing protein
VNGAPLETSLGVLVRTAIEAVGNDARAGFYLANDEGTALHHVVGKPAEYAEAVDGFKVGPDSLACGLATATGEPVLTADVRNEPLWQPWLWMAEKFDYRGCWSFPIHTAARKFVGTLAIYSRQPREATKRDQELGSLLTRTASIIISRHKESEVRKQAEEALRQSEARFRMIADNISTLAWTCDELGNVTWYNKRWLDYTGLTFEEMKDWG